jgi:hypothetical protein
MVEQNTALALRGNQELAQSGEYSGLTMVVSPAEAQRRIQELQAFVQAVMVQGQDFGTIPGTDKPTLLQPGAQKLAEVYGFATHFEDVAVTEDWDRGFFFYRKRCVITSRRDGRYIGDGIGSCNSREGRYAYRWVFANEVPPGIDRRTLKSQEFRSRKTGGAFVKYQLPNPDIFSIVNTLEKMACKRALVAAIIGVTRSAGIFTQDLEDLPREVFGEVEESRSWDKPEKVQAAPEKTEKVQAPPPEPSKQELEETRAGAKPAQQAAAPKPAPAPKHDPETGEVAEPPKSAPAPKADAPAWEQAIRATTTRREAETAVLEAIKGGADRATASAVFTDHIKSLKARAA